MKSPFPIYEFLLWNNCMNNCKFCHQKANKEKHPERFLDSIQQCMSIEAVINFLHSDKFIHGSDVLIMGGEIFDIGMNPTVREWMVSLAKEVVSMMKEYKICRFYVNSNLIYTDTALLYDFLRIFKKADLIPFVKLTTSYDYGCYRFATLTDKHHCETMMERIKGFYPTLECTANTILTKEVCNMLKFEPRIPEYFQKGYGWRQNLIPYIKLKTKGAPQAATKAEVLDVLKTINDHIPNFLSNYVNSFHTDIERRLYEYHARRGLEPVDCGYADCGHSVNFQNVFADTNDCFICACEKLNNLINK